jgi:acyl CoA:acetate/3-ketoacid CoA transferase beta subunit
LAEVCVVACAEAFRGDGEILASGIGLVPSLGARLARATFAPDLLLTDGVASLITNDRVVEGWMPYRAIFDVVWSGRRHVMMGATQLDNRGNQNISCIGDFHKPKAQLLGMRGAPGNTINHTTSYWVPNHSPKVFVPQVDVVSGLGYDRAARLGVVARFHELRRVVSNKGVFDFGGPGHTLRIRSLHPGVSLKDVVASTGFPLVVPEQIETTRAPSADELHLLREVLDPQGLLRREVAA